MRYIFILFLLFSKILTAQIIAPYEAWDTKQLKACNTGKYNKELSHQERQVIYYINLARVNGPLFAKTFLKDVVENEKIPKNKYYRSLVKTLNELPPLKPLQPQDDLIKEAIKHARDMGKTGRKGHVDNKGNTFIVRMKPFYEKYTKLKECNQYGDSDPLLIVIHLLIDDDLESLSHRKSLLHEELEYIGVGVRAHKKYLINCSILMAGGLKQ
ncbi:MAG: hypothetical protein Kow0079_14240 [Vicingaceae bacterium]|jgi:hypothetical protein